ncbi:hypothetical protein [Oceanidesulfovibrio marinus]|uniref:Uncharacterized protein n=1 Tax=Oceanidesulfovibrio marinus TaxID=370038 RepID=A0A6P1ZM44_9BACT|nr:hypothetical protein [Oceanidesulfovibrio marinus]TVM35128.1 hypothetical protein DQK91_06935 [Oceanidesulfovibrio marinus]
MMNCSGYEFEGPYTDMGQLKNAPGVFLVLTAVNGLGWSFIEVGESENIRNAVAQADIRKWNLQNRGIIGIAVHYSEDGPQSRLSMLEHISASMDLPKA